MMCSRQDFNYALIHILIFFMFYAGTMAKLHHDNANFNAWFDWWALSEGLKGVMGTGLAINLTNRSNTENK